MRSLGDFCVGVAAFPDKHPGAPDLEADARRLVEKCDAGADFAITQFFFSADAYFRLRDRVAALGCDMPILPGIMPVTQTVIDHSAWPRCPARSFRRSWLPGWPRRGDDAAAVRAIGVEVASDLATRLLAGGAPGVHFYTLNRSTATLEIFASLGHRTRARTSSALDRRVSHSSSNASKTQISHSSRNGCSRRQRETPLVAGVDHPRQQRQVDLAVDRGDPHGQHHLLAAVQEDGCRERKLPRISTTYGAGSLTPATIRGRMMRSCSPHPSGSLPARVGGGPCQQRRARLGGLGGARASRSGGWSSIRSCGRSTSGGRRPDERATPSGAPTWRPASTCWRTAAADARRGAGRDRPRGEPLARWPSTAQLLPGLAEEVEHLLIPQASGGTLVTARITLHGPLALPALLPRWVFRTLTVRLLARAAEGDCASGRRRSRPSREPSRPAA